MAGDPHNTIRAREVMPGPALRHAREGPHSTGWRGATLAGLAGATPGATPGATRPSSPVAPSHQGTRAPWGGSVFGAARIRVTERDGVLCSVTR